MQNSQIIFFQRKIISSSSKPSKGTGEALKVINVEIKMGATAPQSSRPPTSSRLWVCSNPVPSLVSSARLCSKTL